MNMGIFKRNVEKIYKIAEISGNPKDVYKYLGANKLCDLETINYLCERFETLFAIRKVTVYTNILGIRKSVETLFIPKFSEDLYSTISTLEKLGLNHYNTFYMTSGTIWDSDNWYIHAYAFSTRDDARKALEAYFHTIEKKKAEEIAEQELNSRNFKIHSEEVLI